MGGGSSPLENNFMGILPTSKVQIVHPLNRSGMGAEEPRCNELPLSRGLSSTAQ